MIKSWYYIRNRNKSMIVYDTLLNVNDKIHMDWSSRSPGYSTEKELREKEGIHDKPCLRCGNIIDGMTVNPDADIPERTLCFFCEFWNDKVPIKDLDTVARINGEHYIIMPESDLPSIRGFGGERFKIRFFDGREVITHNLWYQGVIPEAFKDDLPDNAEFVQEVQAIEL